MHFIQILLCDILIFAVITICNEVAKVMLLHLSVILFTGRDYLGRFPLGPGAPPRIRCPPPGIRYTPLSQASTPPGPGTPWDKVHPPPLQVCPIPPGPGTPPEDQVPPPADGYSCGRYPSHWKSFL